MYDIIGEMRKSAKIDLLRYKTECKILIENITLCDDIEQYKELVQELIKCRNKVKDLKMKIKELDYF